MGEIDPTINPAEIKQDTSDQKSLEDFQAQISKIQLETSESSAADDMYLKGINAVELTKDDMEAYKGILSGEWKRDNFNEYQQIVRTSNNHLHPESRERFVAYLDSILKKQ